jgi:hypothetical protein
VKGEFTFAQEKNVETIKHKDQDTKTTEVSTLTFDGTISDFKSRLTLNAFPEKVLAIKEILGITTRNKKITVIIKKYEGPLDKFVDPDVTDTEQTDEQSEEENPEESD